MAAKEEDMKKSKSMAAKEEDRFSELPDCILLVILSLLGCTKQACRTCLLSKRWQLLWINNPPIDLVEPSWNDDDGKISSFIDFISNMLSKPRKSHLIIKFSVDFAFEQRFVGKVNEWVDFAIENKVENINLLFVKEDYLLPQRFYVYSSLTSLSLRCCDISPRAAVKWERLKSLFLYSLSIKHCVLENILSGCRVLEVLSLIHCWSSPPVEHYSFNFTLPSLTTLIIEHWDGKYYEISAPYVLNLSIHHYGQLGFLPNNVSSVVRANLSVNPKYCEELLESLKFVKELEFGTLFLHRVYYKAHSDLKLIQLPQFTLLRCLTLNAYVDKKSIPCIIAFLESAPYLETLFIKGDNEKDIYDNWYVSMDFIMLHLKTVRITNFIRDKTGEAMLTLVKLLLEKAIVLEKMVISAKGLKSSVTSMSLNKISDKLYSFPRASHEAIVEFNI